jgi:hypothetical protein
MIQSFAFLTGNMVTRSIVGWRVRCFLFTRHGNVANAVPTSANKQKTAIFAVRRMLKKALRGG